MVVLLNRFCWVMLPILYVHLWCARISSLKLLHNAGKITIEDILVQEFGWNKQ